MDCREVQCLRLSGSHFLIWRTFICLQLPFDFSWSNGCSDLLSVRTLEAEAGWARCLRVPCSPGVGAAPQTLCTQTWLSSYPAGGKENLGCQLHFSRKTKPILTACAKCTRWQKIRGSSGGFKYTETNSCGLVVALNTLNWLQWSESCAAVKAQNKRGKQTGLLPPFSPASNLSCLAVLMACAQFAEVTTGAILQFTSWVGMQVC